jgi:DNA-binding response OmpR family regulator
MPENLGCESVGAVPILLAVEGVGHSFGEETMQHGLETDGRILLIVDDNRPTADALAKVLKAAQFHTVVSYRGAEAVALAQSHPIAAAVVDIHLPDISGLVVTQKLRERFGPRTPIVIVSGDTSMEMLNSLPHVGATYFFSKPVNTSYLIERLKEWIEQPS